MTELEFLKLPLYEQAGLFEQYGVSELKNGNPRPALLAFRRAEHIYNNLSRDGYDQWRDKQARNWVNFGSAEADIGNLNSAIAHYDKAIRIYSDLIDGGHVQHKPELAKTWTNLGNAKSRLGKLCITPINL